MSTAIHFPNAPLTEALLDIKAVPAVVSFDDWLPSLVRAAQPIYPVAEYLTTIEVGVVKEAGAPPRNVSKQSPAGVILRNPERSRLFQVRPDGFSFHQMRPYSSWESFSAEAMNAWEAYAKYSRAEEVTRLALRYVNRVEIPSGSFYNDYLLLLPQVPDELPQAIINSFTRIAFPFVDEGATAIVTSILEPITATDATMPIILDIDVYKEISIKASNKEAILEHLEALRRVKNKVFGHSFTERAKKMFL